MEQNRFVIITGMSGAGKTQVLRTLEDLNYFCVDNLPVMLLPKFTELSRQTPGRNTAMVIDTRGGDAFSSLVEIMDEMHANGFDFEVLFLDADEATLIRRYKETRRRHPMEKGRYSLAESVSLERNLMTDVKSRATNIIDTSRYSNSLLKEEIGRLFGDENSAPGMLIVVQSFGFKYGLPLDSDLVLDARFLPNPFYIPELKNLTGLNPEVFTYVMKFDQSKRLLDKLCNLVDFLIPLYEKEGKSQLVIAFGCTGGKHRSVAFAEALAQHLREKNHRIRIQHRDIEKR